MHAGPALDRNELIGRIGRRLVADAAVSDGAWHGYALIVRYGDGAIARRMTGFRYDADGAYVAATPDADALGPAFDDLREATRVPGKEPWGACVLRLWRDGGRMAVEFEYDDPGQWDVTPATLGEVARRARPAGPETPGA
ncbi:hypothetical protein [Luteimonas sp. MC1750]|uniref:hypothetical protein n=1 Tax=Luteimonas sp. MC1750 TaxID=2799326 RepID=UPI0018F0CD45|nr:hypothetical protein [Luteimonas sp. MC1750]MBJ6985605.1 hypothetical protein [Luteimonas sp. MC1750]QQO06091.1 hypothetical protein JGR68_01120 [Luteimonas sp. MC1750]